ncbi:MAG TPA: DUF4097 family beta strand repeat-containing protein [Candidatus Cybelea sp.]|jgi:DUF4097 and DUF4098 domain-containing protein YvlB|nr:DUF4097 family beta strand repeat-containing protein [Candidatus Cybelea sp.]
MSTLATLRSQRRWKAAGLLVPGLLLCSAASADRLERHFKVEAHPVVTIHNPNGTVTVRAWTKSDVMVVARRATTEVEVDAEQTGNRVDVQTRQVADTASPDDLRTDFEISVPEDAELQIHNDSGGVNVSNVLGDMNVETIAAGVDLEDTAGYLTVKTVGGAFQCLRCAGRLEVTSISGNFKLIDLRSYYVRAQTSEGNILFNGSFLPNATYVLKNYSGAIEVRFSPGDSFDLSATSLKGKVHNEANLTPSSHHHFVPRFGNALFGTFNSGRARVELNSFDGTINILKRD